MTRALVQGVLTAITALVALTLVDNALGVNARIQCERTPAGFQYCHDSSSQASEAPDNSCSPTYMVIRLKPGSTDEDATDVCSTLIGLRTPGTPEAAEPPHSRRCSTVQRSRSTRQQVSQPLGHTILADLCSHHVDWLVHSAAAHALAALIQDISHGALATPPAARTTHQAPITHLIRSSRNLGPLRSLLSADAAPSSGVSTSVLTPLGSRPPEVHRRLLRTAGNSTATTQYGPPSWVLDRLDQRNLPLDGRFTYPNLGTGVRIYVLDTGVRATHEEFARPDSTRASRVEDVFASAPTQSGGDAGAEGEDCNGHGTHVASLAAGLTLGVAKDAHVKAMRVLSCQGTAYVSSLVAAVEWLIENVELPAVAALAVGEAGQLPVLDDAIARCVGNLDVWAT